MTAARVPDHHSRLSDTGRIASVVYIVDDDVSVRESVELLVRHEGWRPVLFESAQDFLAHPPTSSPSCLVLDLNLPDLSGLDLQKRIIGRSATMPIIFITGYGDVPASVQAMKAGAADFLTKPVSTGVLIEAIRSALARSKRALEQWLAHSQLLRRFESLSKREREVMSLIVQGLLNKQVGGNLAISEVTVKAHRGRVMEKMQAATLVDLVNMAKDLGFETGS